MVCPSTRLKHTSVRIHCSWHHGKGGINITTVVSVLNLMLRGRIAPDSKNQKVVMAGMMCVFIIQMFPQTTPSSPDNGTLTQSVFTAAGGLSAVFTHLTGVKRGRFHNEVQWFMAAGIKMLSES